MIFRFGQKKEVENFVSLTNNKKEFIIDKPLSGKMTVNKKKVNVRLVIEEDGFSYLYWKGKTYLVEISEKNQNRYTVQVDGVSYNISVETPFSYKRKKFLEKNKSENPTETIVAPMPGKIIEVMADENSEIKEGDPIVILEAMKMQNEIISHVSGIIKKVHVKPDMNVNKDDVLIEVLK